MYKSTFSDDEARFHTYMCTVLLVGDYKNSKQTGEQTLLKIT